MVSFKGWNYFKAKASRDRIKQDAYTNCPLCQNGTLEPLMMMETLSCNFCQHLFTLEQEEPLISLPTLKVEDTAFPLSWQWNGQQWKAQAQAEAPLLQWLWCLCAAIALIPSGLMSVAVHLFPATPHSPGAQFSHIWLGLTMMSHSAVALWLLCEHYQWPMYQRLKLWLNRSIASLQP